MWLRGGLERECENANDRMAQISNKLLETQEGSEVQTMVGILRRYRDSSTGTKLHYERISNHHLRMFMATMEDLCLSGPEKVVSNHKKGSQDIG